ncbi:hypothetical protein J437_LFUL019601 [Ladona fulva]|nr:hypothetical protein J437_LFUL019601 [Ladona fulva]
MSIMEIPLLVTASCEIQRVIRFLTAKNKTAVEIHQQISSVYGKDAISVQIVHHWRTMFTKGRETVHDEERSGRPMTSCQADVIDAVCETIAIDKQLSLNEIHANLPPNDYQLVPELKKHLGGQRFPNDADLKNEVDCWARNLATEWCDTGLKKLLSRCKKRRKRLCGKIMD